MERKRLCDYKILYRVAHYGGQSTIKFLSTLHTTYNPNLCFDRYIVLKETKHTYVITELYYPFIEAGDFFDPITDTVYTETKRIYKTATNRFAWETKEAAMADYVRKQKWRRKRLIQELEECNSIILKAERYNAGDDKDNVY